MASFNLNSTLFEQVEYPHLLTDAHGRLWMVCRKRSALSVSRRGVGEEAVLREVPREAVELPP